MLFTTHALVGSAIGTAIGNPLAGFLSGIIFHHVVDSIPHFDGGSFYVGTPLENNPLRPWVERDWLLAITDFVIGSVVGLLLWSKQGYSSIFFFGGLGGVLPDLFVVVPFWSQAVLATKIGKAYGSLHRKFHHTTPISKWYVGITTNLTLIALSLSYLLRS